MKTERIANDKSYKILLEWKNAPKDKWIAAHKVIDNIEDFINGDSIRVESQVGVPKPNTTCENLIAKLDEYIKLLGDEINGLAPYLFTHGIESTRVEAGQKLREEIKELRIKFEQREA